jgi:3-hydroxyacyl-CoA dehydrogenase
MIDYDRTQNVCVLRLNAPPVNTITFTLLEELSAAMRRANQDAAVRGIVLTGDQNHFSAGADVNIFREIATADDAVRASRVFQEAFQEVEDSPKPIVAAVAGKVMGSALELAMACHFRVCAKGTTFSMPEVTLGINPGAGGTQRLPRLIGPEAALKMLLTGEAISAGEALALGLVDAICDEAGAKALLQSGRPALKTRERAEKVRDASAKDAAFRWAESLLKNVRPEIIAPRNILEAVKTGIEGSFEAGLRAEQEVFSECMNTLATRNKIYLFFATRETSKVDARFAVSHEEKPTEIRRAAVIGLGAMGTGIAQAIITAGIPVVVRDENESAARKGMDRISSSIQKRVEQGKLSPQRAKETLGLISATTQWEPIAGADLVVEAVFEDAQVKRSVIAKLEKVCSSNAIIATNTSTISLDVLAEGMKRPERFIGMHFFNPAHRMPLVEVIWRDASQKGIIAAAMKFAKVIRKTPVLVKNREGFLVNRIFIPYLKEAFWLWEEGADPRAMDSAMVEFGFPMGPLTLADMAGLDILAHVDRVMSKVFPSHGCLSPVAIRLVEQGHLGQKSGAGVYKYEKGDYTPHRHDVGERILAKVRRQSGRTPREVGKDEITERLTLRMVNEAFYVLEEGIAQRESDIDAAMVLGTGFPDFRGGVLKYARDLGLSTVLNRLERLEKRFGERFSPCSHLREMKGV